MKFLIIYAHPNPKSLNAEIKREVERTLAKKGGEVKILDLYKEAFNAELPLKELYTIGNHDTSEVIKKHQQLILWSDWLIFIYPTWWYNMPAILKGWCDRVFTSHFAYKFTPKKIPYFGNIPLGLLKGKKALIINTYSSPFLAEQIYGGAGHKVLGKNILRFCGISPVKHLGFYRLAVVDAERIGKILEKVRKTVESLA
ncbi:NAD(P)H-dependent oxidoreductase [Candidatus Woesearchaeota archaeon]|nr:NAD(P)H-dependent oxidoreductase [Candidatus Woesearchaeota archaeon]HIH37750.1 NAD(P)H-dependent oxidoreductase [Candidatus Woesearchaeota archaeon]HIJ02702.1 NAD(P)H-dependent oxidoreductase [Candidatus Woesearchaeota archaeon]